MLAGSNALRLGSGVIDAPSMLVALADGLALLLELLLPQPIAIRTTEATAARAASRRTERSRSDIILSHLLCGNIEGCRLAFAGITETTHTRDLDVGHTHSAVRELGL
jgi:hypothetical protein